MALIPMYLRIFTIGHSTHPLDQFLALLKQHGIEALVDIRRFPGSKRHPHFSRENLTTELPKSGLEYHWLEALGGRRKKETGGPSHNLALRNESFRNYADYMETEDFQKAIEQLLEIAQSKRTAYMCAGGLYWQCHRRLVSDFLLMKGITVEHIMPSGELVSHKLTEGGRIKDNQLSYPAPDSDQTRLLFD
jgi:uncharacterized protein (DUF488 family)